MPEVFTASRHRTQPAVHQLVAFLTVANSGSFTAAAQLLGTTQPAVSQTIRRLEDIYGGDLFERGRGRTLALTPIGEAILPSAKTILDIIEQQMDDAGRAAQSRTGTLRLGFDCGLVVGPLRSALERFTADASDVRLMLRDDKSAALLEQLISRSLDLIVTTAAPNSIDQRLDQERLWEERLVVAMPTSHPLVRRRTVDWQALAATLLIVREATNDAHMYRRLLDSTSDPVRNCVKHAVSRGALLAMVGMGLGVSIMMESVFVPHPGVIFRPIAEDDAHVAVHAVWRADDRNPLRHRLLQALRSRPGPRCS